ncbi:hypothetical protein U1Q18_023064 [Sarracenia purpurea var. burkii]
MVASMVWGDGGWTAEPPVDGVDGWWCVNGGLMAMTKLDRDDRRWWLKRSAQGVDGDTGGVDGDTGWRRGAQRMTGDGGWSESGGSAVGEVLGDSALFLTGSVFSKRERNLTYIYNLYRAVTAPHTPLRVSKKLEKLNMF